MNHLNICSSDIFSFVCTTNRFEDLSACNSVCRGRRERAQGFGVMRPVRDTAVILKEGDLSIHSVLASPSQQPLRGCVSVQVQNQLKRGQIQKYTQYETKNNALNSTQNCMIRLEFDVISWLVFIIFIVSREVARVGKCTSI